MKDSISVIMPAYSEARTLKDAVKVAIAVLRDFTQDFEIIIVDDGSTDSTLHLAMAIAKKNSRVSFIHHQSNEGFGRTFRDGLAMASKEYVTGFPADNDLSTVTFRNLIAARRPDAIVSTYMTSMREREFIRQIFSHAFTNMMNLLFGLKLKYYTGYFIGPRKLIQPLTLTSNGFTLFPEIKIRLIKQGVPCIEIPFEYKPRLFGASKSLDLKNILQALSFFYWAIKFKKE